MKTLLVTGGAGFIGSNFVRLFTREHPDVDVVNFDKLTYSGNLENLSGILEQSGHTFVRGDICDAGSVQETFKKFRPDAIVHFAAESHVDRSIVGSAVFVQTNVIGTQVLLEEARRNGVERFIHVSTDEVYGSLGPTGRFTETTPLHPNSPYAASKAGSDLLALAYYHTHGLPVIVTRCSNNYGPYQFPEKLIPLMILNAVGDKSLPVYGDGLQVRDWIHVDDHNHAIIAVLNSGTPGEVYNIGGDSEQRNIDVVKQILAELGKPESLIQFVKDRPGHDRRYAMDSKKIMTELGWIPRFEFQQGIKETVQWYLHHKDWCDNITSGEYQEYYKMMYHDR